MSDDWQPIETAPRDGTRVLMAGTHLSGDTIVYEVMAWSEEHACWVCSEARLFETHWQPLPDPPGSDRDPKHMTHDEYKAFLRDHVAELIDEAGKDVPQSCGSCRFWLAGGVVPDGFGKCTRFPPAVITLWDPCGETTVIANQPVTPEDTTCGEWAARKVELLKADVCPTTGGDHPWLDTSTNDGPGRKCQKCGREG